MENHVCKEFACLTCDRRHVFKNGLLQKQQDEDECLECECKARFSSAVTFAEHRRSHFGLHCCCICFTEFVDKNLLDIHISGHARAFGCPECEMRFLIKDDMMAHHQTVHGEEHFTCWQCGIKFMFEQAHYLQLVEEHREKHMNKDYQIQHGQLMNDDGSENPATYLPEPYVCLECGAQIKKNCTFIKHKCNQGYPYNCHVCGLLLVSSRCGRRHRKVNCGRKSVQIERSQRLADRDKMPRAAQPPPSLQRPTVNGACAPASGACAKANVACAAGDGTSATASGASATAKDACVTVNCDSVTMETDNSLQQQGYSQVADPQLVCTICQIEFMSLEAMRQHKELCIQKYPTIKPCRQLPGETRQKSVIANGSDSAKSTNPNEVDQKPVLCIDSANAFQPGIALNQNMRRTFLRQQLVARKEKEMISDGGWETTNAATGTEDHCSLRKHLRGKQPGGQRRGYRGKTTAIDEAKDEKAFQVMQEILNASYDIKIVKQEPKVDYGPPPLKRIKRQ